MQTELGKQSKELTHRLTSLRARLLVILFLTLLPVYSLLLYFIFEARQHAADNALRDASSLTRLVALEQKNLIEFGRQQLLNLVQLPVVRHADWVPLCNRTFADLLRNNPLFANLGVIAPDGTIRCSAVPFSGHIDLSDRDYFREAMRTHAFALWLLSDRPRDRQDQRQSRIPVTGRSRQTPGSRVHRT